MVTYQKGNEHSVLFYSRQGADGLVPFAVAALYGNNECFKGVHIYLSPVIQMKSLPILTKPDFIRQI